MDSSAPGSPDRDASLPNHPESDYSLDLQALTNDSEPITEIGPPTNAIQEVRSDDIDGPSDFTEFMEDWMRGKKKLKGTKRVTRGVAGFGNLHSNTEGIPKPEDTDIADSEEDNLPRAPYPSVNGHYPNDDHFEAIPETSAWDEYDRSTPSPTRKARELLQPTVEDMYSQLSIARPASAPPDTHHITPNTSKVSFSIAPPNPPSHWPQDVLSDAELERLRTELMRLRHEQDQTFQVSKHLETQLVNANDARRDLQSQLNASTNALRLANDERSNRLSELESALTTARFEADAAKNTLSEANSQIRELQTQLEEMRESEDAELHEVRLQLKASRDNENKLSQSLEEAQSGLRAAVEDVNRLRSDLESERTRRDSINNFSDIEQELKDAKILLQAARDEASQLREQKKLSICEYVPAREDELTKANEHISELEEELNLLQDLSRLDFDDEHIIKEDSNLEEVITLRAKLQQIEAELADSRQSAAEKSSQIENLKAQIKANTNIEQPIMKPDSSSNDLMKEEFSQLRKALRESEQKRLDLHARVDDARNELDNLHAANAEMDQRVAESLRKREDTWKAKEMAWQTERRVMGKALLRQWGREECGIEIDKENQRYRYQYLNTLTDYIKM